MNKIKNWLWIKPNEYFDIYWPHLGIILNINVGLIILDWIFNFNNPVVDFTTGIGAILGIYRLFWEWLSEEEIEEDEVSSYDFDPIFFKSATREHLFSALESAKLSRQLAAAQEDDWEFQCWELVIQDIESVIDSYGE